MLSLVRTSGCRILKRYQAEIKCGSLIWCASCGQKSDWCNSKPRGYKTGAKLGKYQT
ncbi:hypothetical protein SARC_14904 [Sphaeroforma arctica JP610]|uniref:Uncharacterized protein n=1 Tax=Sphaeroforma arctica JP610 TaxID=667725 RepID=A0A0L0F8U3_9EUKA|nr:hypothetical protein SARC_14904 [Sphaeroforma arctica JP610]KNC72538.1 hypothetical protein SARC_14904 [Sphaeroforma arctica JP610]|eukprot:XP_014146440.1 hypothetical protein SARC_14904 [Sphaeroforma arctica JP610]